MELSNPFFLKQAKMKLISYRLVGDAKPVGWQLPLNEVLIERDGILKKIKFVPGVNSFFAEDIAGDLKSQSIWFSGGRHDVPENDTVKNALMQAHPWFNLKYKIYSKESESKEKLEGLRVSANAIRLIDDADSEKIKAIALAIFGYAAFNWDDSTAELELRQYAKEKPMELQKEMDSKSYESKYLSALAFNKGIVKEGMGKTAVIWNDTTEGVITRVAKGEKGLNKLADFLSEVNEQSHLVLQEISSRLDKIETKTTEKDILSEKDREIQELRAQLAAKHAPSAKTGTSEMTLEEATAKYLEKHQREVANVKKNDLEWIKSKL